MSHARYALSLLAAVVVGGAITATVTLRSVQCCGQPDAPGAWQHGLLEVDFDRRGPTSDVVTASVSWNVYGEPDGVYVQQVGVERAQENVRAFLEELNQGRPYPMESYPSVGLFLAWEALAILGMQGWQVATVIPTDPPRLDTRWHLQRTLN